MNPPLAVLFGVRSWALGGVLLIAAILAALHIAAGRSKRRTEWAPVLEAEVKRWSAKSCAQLLLELHDAQAYEIEFESTPYQVEVELLENTAKYVHVMVAVDDGTLPASIRPLTATFLRYKDAVPLG